MRLLLDTHSFLWFIAGDERLSDHARSLIADMDNEALLRFASLWEIAIKLSIGKLSLSKSYDELITEQLVANDIQVLPIDMPELSQVARLPFHHRDPFDRLIVAQTMAKGLTLVSQDPVFSSYGVQVMWEA